MVCVVNTISFAALGMMERGKEISAELTGLTHLSGFAAGCVTTAGHKAGTDLECRAAAGMQVILEHL